MGVIETEASAEERLEAALVSYYDMVMAAVAAGYQPRIIATPPVVRVPITDYLLPGEDLATVAATDASPLMQRAIDAVSAWATGAAAHRFPAGRGAQIFAPALPNKYKMLTTVKNRTKVGWAGEDGTVFQPVGTAMFLEGPVLTNEPAGGWTFYDDQSFTDFEVDLNLQTAEPGFGARKGMFFQNQRRPFWDNVRMDGSFASCWGIDFVIDGVAINCKATNFGRGQGTDGDEQGPTTSGFAPGTGRFADEGMVWIDCEAYGGQFGAGWLFENLNGRGAIYRPDRFMIVNGRSNGNKYGASDIGAGGLAIIGGDFSRNTHSSLVVSGANDRLPGKRGRVVGTKMNYNGGNVHGPGQSGNGVIFTYGASPEDYSIDADFFGNAHAGVYVHESCRPDIGGLRIRGRADQNAYGIKIDNLQQRLKGLDVDMTFGVNSVADIWVDGGLIMPRFRTTHRGSPIGYRWSPDRPATKSIVDAAFLDVVQEMVNAPTDKSNWGRIVSEKSIVPKVAALAGAAPFYTEMSRSGSSSTQTGLAHDYSTSDTTAYVVIDRDPGSNEIELSLRNAGGNSLMSMTRQTGNANWRATSMDGAASQGVAVAAPTGRAVLAMARTATELRIHVHGVGSATVPLSGFHSDPIITTALRSSKVPFATAFAGAHSEATRNAIMAALAAEFVTI
jgi:hypothetical protein